MRPTSFPAANLGIEERGRLKAGYFADIAIFDAATIQDHATFVEPHQYSTGVRQVFVNGVQVLADGEHTGATPGRVLVVGAEGEAVGAAFTARGAGVTSVSAEAAA